MQPKPEGYAVTIKVTEALAVTDRSLPTASDWERHLLVPGEYPAQWDSAVGVWYAMIPSTLIGRYSVNSLMGLSMASYSRPGTPSAYYVSVRGYEVEGSPGTLTIGLGYRQEDARESDPIPFITAVAHAFDGAGAER